MGRDALAFIQAGAAAPKVRLCAVIEANPDSPASVNVSLASSNANRASCSTKLRSFVMS